MTAFSIFLLRTGIGFKILLARSFYESDHIASSTPFINGNKIYFSYTPMLPQTVNRLTYRFLLFKNLFRSGFL